ncbi:uncharacterized protein LOC136086367 [Hydra vulgaris]|uniref:Uncharacterized protein LOC136086367 n=1 Tax=Hydra vulgaris TaxID=6087 RepID=A0ABM4CS92_HYDVU
MRWIVALSMPFNVADHKETKEFFKKQLPRVTVKNSTTFAKLKLPLLYEHIPLLYELEQELPEVDGFALTSDMWTSRANEAYMSLTLHFVNRNFNLIKKVISCKHFPGSHTAVAIAVEIDKQIESLPNVKSECEKVVVHDAAANMRASFPNSSQLSYSLLCADHAINLVLQKAVEGCKPVQKAITKATLLSNKTHRSTLANELIKKACKDVGVAPIKVIAPVSTRWNSNAMMIKSILKIQPALKHLQNKKYDFIPTQAELQVLAIPILELFKELSEKFSADSVPTIHLICGELFRIQHLLTDRVNTSDDLNIQNFATKLLEQLEQRFELCGTKQDLYALSHLLHPSFKGAVLHKMNRFNNIETKLIDSHLSGNNANRQSTPEESNIIDQTDPLEQLVFETNWKVSDCSSNKTKSNMEEELNKYLAMPRPDPKELDILMWWRNSSTSLPLLSKLALKLLCIPVTSASSKRVFSVAGGIVTNQRHKQMQNKHVVFCHSNMAKIKRNLAESIETEEEKKQRGMEKHLQ